MLTSVRISKTTVGVFVGLLFFVHSAATNPQTKTTSAPKIYAQKLVTEILSGHPELEGLEIAATAPGRTQCVTIATNEPKGLGEKCDKDEFTAIKTNKPFVEREKENGNDVYDVTIPIHDSTGKIIATAGIDFKPGPNQTNASITGQAQQLIKEIESKVKSKEKLFEPVA